MEKPQVVLTPEEKKQWLWLRGEGYTLENAWDIMKEHNPRLRDFSHPDKSAFKQEDSCEPKYTLL